MLPAVAALLALSMSAPEMPISRYFAQTSCRKPHGKSQAIVRLAEPTLEELRHGEVRRLGMRAKRHPGCSGRRRLYNRHVIARLQPAGRWGIGHKVYIDR